MNLRVQGHTSMLDLNTTGHFRYLSIQPCQVTLFSVVTHPEAFEPQLRVGHRVQMRVSIPNTIQSKKKTSVPLLLILWYHQHYRLSYKLAVKGRQTPAWILPDC